MPATLFRITVALAIATYVRAEVLSTHACPEVTESDLRSFEWDWSERERPGLYFESYKNHRFLTSTDRYCFYTGEVKLPNSQDFTRILARLAVNPKHYQLDGDSSVNSASDEESLRELDQYIGAGADSERRSWDMLRYHGGVDIQESQAWMENVGKKTGPRGSDALDLHSFMTPHEKARGIQNCERFIKRLHEDLLGDLELTSQDSKIMLDLSYFKLQHAIWNPLGYKREGEVHYFQFIDLNGSWWAGLGKGTPKAEAEYYKKAKSMVEKLLPLEVICHGNPSPPHVEMHPLTKPNGEPGRLPAKARKTLLPAHSTYHIPYVFDSFSYSDADPRAS